MKTFMLTLLLCNSAPSDSFRIAFWNVENLFYPVDDDQTLDDAYTPDGENHWTWNRYYQKLDKVAKTLAAIGRWEKLDIVGLCEVENCYVLEDLLTTTPLKGHYRYLHQDSPDPRGIDVALLYKPSTVDIIATTWVPLPDSLVDPPKPLHTREIMKVKFRILDKKDTMTIFVNHWPSRYSGQMATEPKRVLAGQVINDFTTDENSIICGDFNDHPQDRSIQMMIQNSPVPLINKMTEVEGTHKYGGEWGILDMFIVGRAISDRSKATVFRAYWLLESEGRYLGKRPRRTFQGPIYKGGFSDHLPIVLSIATN